MSTYFPQAVSALHRLRPLLNNTLYDGLLAAIAERDDVMGARWLVNVAASHLSAMPSPSGLEGRPRVALRFLFAGGDSRFLYLVERPRSKGDASPVAYFEQAHETAPLTLRRKPIGELLEQGVILDVTFDPGSFHEYMAV